ncbi:MAG: hypothetical protein RhofKO_25600 [Rhodothermales bacterium]
MIGGLTAWLAKLKSGVASGKLQHDIRNTLPFWDEGFLTVLDYPRLLDSRSETRGLPHFSGY